MIKTVFIDIDGTITDNFHIHTKGWDAILKEMKKQIDISFYQNLHGADTKMAIIKIAAAVNYTLKKHELEKFILLKNEIRNFEINKLTESNLYNGVINFLEDLSKNEVRIVCCSISSACSMILEKLKVVHYFEDFICGSKMIELKSCSPNCYIDFINLYNLNQNECLVIDDDIDVLLNIKQFTKIKFLGVGVKTAYKQNNILSITNYDCFSYEKLNNYTKS